MTEWLTYILTTIGLVYFITQSSIFSPFRMWLTEGSSFRQALLYCPSCTGFWVGLGLSAGLVPGRPGGFRPVEEHLLTIFLGCFMSMAIAHIWSALTQQGVNPAWVAEYPQKPPPPEVNTAPQEPPDAT